MIEKWQREADWLRGRLGRGGGRHCRVALEPCAKLHPRNALAHIYERHSIAPATAICSGGPQNPYFGANLGFTPPPSSLCAEHKSKCWPCDTAYISWCGIHNSTVLITLFICGLFPTLSLSLYWCLSIAFLGLWCHLISKKILPMDNS